MSGPGEVFVSYASKDQEKVLDWVRQLESAGVPVWIAPQNIEGGVSWPHAVVEAIEGCRVFLLMLSPASVDSPHVLREVALAAEAMKPILPVLLEPVNLPRALRYPLAGIQHVDLYGGDSEEKLGMLLRALTRLGVMKAQPPLPS
jgi:hypothetical protein